MATSLGSLSLPGVPAGWQGDKDFKALGRLSGATARNIEPVGAHFLAEARRKRHKRTFSEDERIRAQEAVKKTEDLDDGDISEPEDAMLLSRDAKDWKQQDHYAVLGITKYRYKATNEQIKRANRKKVLKHHPDKRAAQGGAEDDSFFKCIQKATEVLLDPVKRRQYDSVDEAADVDPPSKKQSKDHGGKNFFKLWNPVFDSEARFSKTTPVPRLGDDRSTKDDVETFYNFWYNFDSWRSFEYLDEDVPDDSADRDQRRHVERKNFNQRKKKKAEDNARLRELIDTCLSLDERIAKFRKAEKEQKNKKKNEREAAEKKAAEEAAAAKVAAEKAAAEKEAADKAEREQGKKAKEAAKNAVKKNKRVVRGAVKDAGYFAGAGATASPGQIDAVLNDTDLLLTKLDADELAALTSKLGGEKDAGKIQAIFSETASQATAAGKLKADEAKSLRGA